jgi:hypothetical protein
MSELKRLAQQFVLKTVLHEGTPGKLGNSAGTLYYTDPQGTLHRDQVWVRVAAEGGMAEVVAYCTAVNPQLHLPVRVAKRDGRLTVIGVDRGLAAQFGGGRLPDLPRHWWTHLWLGPDPAFLDSRSFMGMGVRPSNPPALTVDVDGGFYRYNGALYYLADQTSTSLSAYVPSASGVRHFVILCLNRAAAALAIVDGADKLVVAGDITGADVAGVSIPAAYYPLAAIRLNFGATAIRLPDIIFDVRPWGGDTSLGSSTASGGWVVDYNAIIPENRDAFIPGIVSVLDGYTLTVEGELFIV